MVGATTLDGEIVAIDGGGRISFNLLSIIAPMLKRCCSMRSTLPYAEVRAFKHSVGEEARGLQIDTCPFVNLPEKKRTLWAREEMKNCLWVEPELVAQIEFGEWTPDGHLRHSNFVGLREDKDPQEVLREV